MGTLTAAQVKNGLRDRNSFVQFLNTALGYKTMPIAYEDPAEELRIPPYLSARTNSWWLMCSYHGKVPFQIHFVEVKELTFYTCKDIAASFLRSHPANYLFIFTQDYRYMVFLSAERCLEKRPYSWRLEPKYYWRQLLVDCSKPGANELTALNRLRIEPECTDPLAIYDKVITALKLASNEVPEWFMPWYYRMGHSEDAYERLRESGMI